MDRTTLFAYLDIDRPMVAWETAVGRIQSAGANGPGGFGISHWMFNHLRALAYQGATQKILAEFRLEQARMSRYPNCVSRLHGVYFFESRSDAETAIDRWGLPNHYQRYVSAVEFEATAMTAVDSEWITWNLLSPNGTDWMDAYWSGESAGESPLTEILAVGRGTILNTELRSEAYELIYNLWPESTPLLAAAACAFACKNFREVALVKPGILTTDEGLAGNYFIYMGEFDERQDEVVAAVEECQQSGEMPSIILPSDGESIFRLPDLRTEGFSIDGVGLSAALRGVSGE